MTEDLREATTPLFRLTDCSGALRWQDHSLDISFVLECNHTGEISIILDRLLASRDTAFLRELFRTPDADISLQATTPNGSKVAASAAYFTRWGSSYDRAIGDYFDLTMSSLDLTVHQPPADSSPGAVDCIQYWLPGVRSFGPVSAQSSLGTFSLKASHRERDVEVLDSQLLLSQTRTDPAGVEAADHAVDRILRVLSLAQGRSITWGVREIPRGSEGLDIQFRGANRTTKPDYPLMPALHLEPALEAATRYAEKPEGSTGLARAIGWMVMNPQFTEGTFVVGMVSLESLLALRQSKNERRLMPQDKYTDDVLPALQAALEQLADSDPSLRDPIVELVTRLPTMNRSSLRMMLDVFFHRTAVPADDLLPDVPRLVSARNQLVHSGRLEREEELDHLVGVLRELLSRVMLTLLEYKGPYISYFPKYGNKQFPPS